MTYASMDFNTALTSFISGCQTISDMHNEKNFPNAPKSQISTSTGGKTFIRVVRTDRGQGGSAHCFVAVADGSNKKMGSWKAGDVFKCDDWSSPARGARGNIFDANNGITRMGPYGAEYNA
jgi:hypothetical protein